jgi:hypothetical protein
MDERIEADGIDGPTPPGTVGRSEAGGVLDGVQQWVILDGSRVVIAVGISALVAAVVFALVTFDVARVGSGSQLPTLLGSGLTSGLLTLVAVALSINQLILSRVFDSPNTLADRLDGTAEFRETVRELADVTATPDGPARFLALIGRTMNERADRLHAALGDPNPEFDNYLDCIGEYADGLVEARNRTDSTTELLSTLLGPGYADNIVVTEHLLDEYAVDDDATERLDALRELLESVAVTRQFFKTLAIQQDLARLSRMLVYFGLVALLVIVGLTLSYTSSAVSIDPALRPYAASVGLGVVVGPLAILVSYMLRVATVALYSVSVGPFVPPEERSGQ